MPAQMEFMRMKPSVWVMTARKRSQRERTNMPIGDMGLDIAAIDFRIWNNIMVFGMFNKSQTLSNMNDVSHSVDIFNFSNVLFKLKLF